MKYNNIIIYKKINIALFIFSVLALFLSFSWTNNAVFARSDILSLANNIANQAIGQAQSSVQNALCFNGISDSSCNNTSVQDQVNHGNNALSQISGLGFGPSEEDHHDKGNLVSQAIGQAQSSVQNALCLTGISDSSCNNTSVQDQVNHGNNALSQISGLGFGPSERHHHHGGDEANLASQSINQGQSNIQNANCVSGSSLDHSCNNTSVQDQVNHGNNAAAQHGSNGFHGGDEANLASQSINQGQSNSQFIQCVSGDSLSNSCNNTSVQDQVNHGNNAAAQQGSNGFHGGDEANLASQSINQGQSNSQFIQCVSGDSLSNSCNNTSVQDQVNHGNNAAAQQGGSGRSLGDGPENVASQSINQGQSSDQNAQCVSGKDAIVSCNNLNLQKQINTGKNVLSQSFQ